MKKSKKISPSRILLATPHLSGREAKFVAEAFRTNWIAPLGPQVDAFEREFAAKVGSAHAAALSSGTAALHLALVLLGVQAGDEVICSTFTFSASINVIVYQQATPVLVDSDRGTWNLDPNLLEAELRACRDRNRLPKAVIVVHLYGQSADLDPIVALCREYQVPLVEDAAEALGATYRGRSVGTFGRLGAFSFNGNKIITTSGGGMLVSDEGDLIARARFLATQARDPAPHYEHSVIGYNYRLSNVLAGIGRGQLGVLDQRVEEKRRIFDFYRQAFQEEPGIEFMPEASYGRSTRWLTCILVDPEKFGADREDVRVHLDRNNIEARPLWKPMHLQPVFAGCRCRGGAVAEDLFARGLCLPSGTNLTREDLARVAQAVLATPRR
ncbi:MAG: pyridoxal phosphate-dependent aminotransferase [Deltaproteobacteria bacterium RBG_13_61_14]|nr:MAG: pyridoxal phosphate-dependent aminotransferase [Deltaproteobacteria bacterium RBG_13_61_14]